MKDLDGSGRSLTEVLPRNLSRDTGRLRNTLSEQPVFRPRFEPNFFRIRVENVTIASAYWIIWIHFKLF
jgi:hypothetical protein